MAELEKKSFVKLLKKLQKLEEGKLLNKQTTNKLKKVIVQEINKTLDKGFSPVRGFKKFEDLSDNYKKYKEKAGLEGKPDFKVTGALRDSIKVTDIERNGALGVQVKIGVDYASYHDEGEGKQPERRLLPNSDERFNTRIEDAILDILKKRRDKFNDE